MCEEEADLTQMSQSAIYQLMAPTDGPHTTANSKPLVSNTSTLDNALIWHRALFYLQSNVTCNFASEQYFIVVATICSVIFYYEKYLTFHLVLSAHESLVKFCTYSGVNHSTVFYSYLLN